MAGGIFCRTFLLTILFLVLFYLLKVSARKSCLEIHIRNTLRLEPWLDLGLIMLAKREEGWGVGDGWFWKNANKSHLSDIPFYLLQIRHRHLLSVDPNLISLLKHANNFLFLIDFGKSPIFLAVTPSFPCY